MAEPDDNYVECKLVTLKSIQESKNIPDDIRELVVDRYKGLRNEISQLVGNMELAYRRGYAAGMHNALTDGIAREKDEYKRLAELFIDRPCEKGNCDLMSGVPMKCPPCQVRFQMKVIEESKK